MKYPLIPIIKIYQMFVSPLFMSLFGGGCRFTPTCSRYTIESVEKFGTVRGLVLGLTRFLKCHPWGGSGYDPVPGNIKV